MGSTTYSGPRAPESCARVTDITLEFTCNSTRKVVNGVTKPSKRVAVRQPDSVANRPDLVAEFPNSTGARDLGIPRRRSDRGSQPGRLRAGGSARLDDPWRASRRSDGSEDMGGVVGDGAPEWRLRYFAAACFFRLELR